MSDTTGKRIAELERLIRRHQKLYYNGQPELIDAEFDELWDELARSIRQSRSSPPSAPTRRTAGPRRATSCRWAARRRPPTPRTFWPGAPSRASGISSPVQAGRREPRAAVRGRRTRQGGYARRRRIGDDIRPNASRDEGRRSEAARALHGGLRGEVLMPHAVHDAQVRRQGQLPQRRERPHEAQRRRRAARTSKSSATTRADSSLADGDRVPSPTRSRRPPGSRAWASRLAPQEYSPNPEDGDRLPRPRHGQAPAALRHRRPRGEGKGDRPGGHGARPPREADRLQVQPRGGGLDRSGSRVERVGRRTTRPSASSIPCASRALPCSAPISSIRTSSAAWASRSDRASSSPSGARSSRRSRGLVENPPSATPIVHPAALLLRRRPRRRGHAAVLPQSGLPQEACIGWRNGSPSSTSGTSARSSSGKLFASGGSRKSRISTAWRSRSSPSTIAWAKVWPRKYSATSPTRTSEPARFVAGFDIEGIGELNAEKAVIRRRLRQPREARGRDRRGTG